MFKLFQGNPSLNVGDILLMVILAVAIIVAAIVIGSLQGVVTTLNVSSESMNVISTAVANALAGLNIATIGIIVLAAMAILGVVISFLAPPGKRGR
ncbi:MAG: hypothetical protein QXM37_02640 [Candidatus Bathyarchaeia archaeon]